MKSKRKLTEDWTCEVSGPDIDSWYAEGIDLEKHKKLVEAITGEIDADIIRALKQLHEHEI